MWNVVFTFNASKHCSEKKQRDKEKNTFRLSACDAVTAKRVDQLSWNSVQLICKNFKHLGLHQFEFEAGSHLFKNEECSSWLY